MNTKFIAALAINGLVWAAVAGLVFRSVNAACIAWAGSFLITSAACGRLLRVVAK